MFRVQLLNCFCGFFQLSVGAAFEVSLQEGSCLRGFQRPMITISTVSGQLKQKLVAQQGKFKDWKRLDQQHPPPPHNIQHSSCHWGFESITLCCEQGTGVSMWGHFYSAIKNKEIDAWKCLCQNNPNSWQEQPSSTTSLNYAN